MIFRRIAVRNQILFPGRLVLGQFWWIRDEELTEALSWLQQFRDGLTMDCALELFVEIRESVRKVLLRPVPHRLSRPEAAAHKDWLADLLSPDAFTAFLLFFSAPLVQYRKIGPFATLSSTLSWNLSAPCQSRSVILRNL